MSPTWETANQKIQITSSHLPFEEIKFQSSKDQEVIASPFEMVDFSEIETKTPTLKDTEKHIITKQLFQ